LALNKFATLEKDCYNIKQDLFDDIKIQHQLTFLNGADSKNTFLLMLTTDADFLVLLIN